MCPPLLKERGVALASSEGGETRSPCLQEKGVAPSVLGRGVQRRSPLLKENKEMVPFLEERKDARPSSQEKR